MNYFNLAIIIFLLIALICTICALEYVIEKINNIKNPPGGAHYDISREQRHIEML